MGRVVSSFVPGIHVAGDGILWHRHEESRDGRDRLIIVSHGRTPGSAQFQEPLQFDQPSIVYSKLHKLLAQGYAIVVVGNKGPLTYGNDAAIDSVDKAIAWARANWAHPTAKVVVMGYSMGGIPSTYYAKNNASKVAGFLGFAPGLDLAWLASTVPYNTEVTAAFGGAPPAGRDPMSFASTFPVPAKLYHAKDDSAIPIAKTQAWYDALTGKKELTIFPSGDHAGFWNMLDPTEIASWLNGLDW